MTRRTTTLVATWHSPWVFRCAGTGNINGNTRQFGTFPTLNCGDDTGRAFTDLNIQKGDTLLGATRMFAEFDNQAFPIQIIRTIWDKPVTDDIFLKFMPRRVGDLFDVPAFRTPIRVPNILPGLFPPGSPVVPDTIPYRKVKDVPKTPRNPGSNRPFIQGHIKEKPKLKLKLDPKRGEKLAKRTTITVRSTPQKTIVSTKTIQTIHKPKRPPPLTLEEKFISWLHGMFIRWGMQPTEALDFIDSLYSALPNHIRANEKYHGSPGKRIKALYENWNTIDVKGAVIAVALNQIEDAIIGGINRKVNQIGAKDDLRNWFMLKGKLTIIKHVVKPEDRHTTSGKHQ